LTAWKQNLSSTKSEMNSEIIFYLEFCRFFFIISINTIFLILQVWLTKICSDPGNHVYLYMCTDMYTVDKVLFSVVGYISLLASTHYVRFTLYPLYQFLILNSCSYKYMTYVERCLRPTPVICYLPVKYTCISVQ